MVKYIGLDGGSIGKTKIVKGKLVDGEPEDFKTAIKIKLVRAATKDEITKLEKADKKADKKT